MTKNQTRTLAITQIALLSALVIIIDLFLSSIRVGPVTLSFVLVPIVIAGVCVSPLAGAIVGLVAGIATVIQVFTSADAFYVMLVTYNPLATVAVCLLKTALAGFLSGELYKIISRKSKHRSLMMLFPAALCPIVNTGVFVIFMITCFADGIVSFFQSLGVDTSSGVVSLVIISLAGINFVVELCLNLVVCPLIGKALFATRFFGKK